MAILHYQFEAIHPFPDGNGRTGRILNILSLIEAGLLEMPTLYLSRFILNTRGDYYRLLERVTFYEEWEPWLLYMLAAVEETSGWTMLKVRAVRALMDETVAYVRAAAPKLPHAVVEQIFTYPYCRIANLVEQGIAGREAVSKYLRDLVRLHVMEEEKVGRDKVFLHRKYIDVLFGEEHAFQPYPRPPQSARARAAKRRA
jgi:Fic family protein